MDAPLLPEPPLKELFGDLATQTSQLVSKEIALAKVELTAKVELAAKRAALAVAGAIACAVAAVCLFAALILGLGTLMPLWVSALVVGLVVAAVGATLALSGVQSLKKLDFRPTETIETLMETKSWLKRELAK